MPLQKLIDVNMYFLKWSLYKTLGSDPSICTKSSSHSILYRPQGKQFCSGNWHGDSYVTNYERVFYLHIRKQIRNAHIIHCKNMQQPSRPLT